MFLVAWDAEAAKELAETLEALGWSVEVETVDGAVAWRRMRSSPPDVLAVDLTRLPSHGRETARAVRAAKEFKQLPIIFFGGTSEARSRAAGFVAGSMIAETEDLAATLQKIVAG